MKHGILAAAIFVSLAAGTAGAQDWAYECAGDAQKFCPGIMPGDTRLIECLKDHEAELSAPCRARGQELKKDVSTLNQVCAGDLEKFCAEVGPEPGDKIRCLKTNEAKLSDGCRTKLDSGAQKFNRTPAARKKKTAKNNPCTADIKEFCAGLDRKGVSACLKENADALSGGCKAHLAAIKARAIKRAKALKARRAAEKAEREQAAETQDDQQEN